MLSVSNHCASECTHAPVIFEGCVHGHSEIFVIYKLPQAIRSNGETCAPPTLRVWRVSLWLIHELFSLYYSNVWACITSPALDREQSHYILSHSLPAPCVG